MITRKSIVLAALVCCLMGGSSLFGSSIFDFCTPLGSFSGGAGGPLSEVCGNFATDGGGTIGTAPGQDTITGIEVWFVADYDGGLTPSNQVSVLFGTPSVGVWSVPGVDPCVVTGGGSSTANTCNVYSGTVTAPGTENIGNTDTGATLQTDAATPFSVAVSSVVNSGTVQNSIGDVIVEYDYSVNASVGGVPEPATLSLVGGALLGVGLLRKKIASVK
jgi:PEP-CTERM motif